MWGNMVLLFAWGLAGLVAYMSLSTLGSKLKKDDATLYEQIKDDPKVLEGLINTEENTNQAHFQAEIDAIDRAIENGTLSEDKDDWEAQQKLRAAKVEKVAECEAKIKQYKLIQEKGLDAIDLSFSNLAWSAAWFFGIGIILHLIINQCMKIFKNKKQ